MNTSDFYRRNMPSTFADLVFANDLDREDLGTYVARRRYDHMIFYGPNGAAKTTTAVILIEERQRAINAPNIMVELFSGRDLNGNIDAIMDRMDTLICPAFVGDNQPYVIIDEVDQMTVTSQYDLRMLMDRMPVGKLIMTTNNYNTLDKGVRDRSAAFELLHPTPEQWLPRAQAIIAAEGFHVSDVKLLKGLSTASRTGDLPTLRDMMRFLAELTASLK